MITKKLLLNSFVLVLWLFVQVSGQGGFPQSVINYMATRQMRYHHWLWHQVRENWYLFSASTQQAFRNIGWAPPRPARSYDSNGNPSVILDNNSGEDFLYMHRQMLATANGISPVTGWYWSTIPGPGNSSYPVPGTYSIPGSPETSNSLGIWKSGSFFNTILGSENMFTDPSQLRSMTLGELGARIDGTIHTWLHMRWSAYSSYGYRTSYSGTIPDVDKKWDNVEYNWLGDPYASHVNPLFYCLHGWIDNTVEAWRKANGLSSITWVGTWTGGPASSLSNVMKESSMTVMQGMDPGDGSEIGDILQQAFKIFKQSGVPETTFFNSKPDRILPATTTGKKMRMRRLCTKSGPNLRKSVQN